MREKSFECKKIIHLINIKKGFCRDKYPKKGEFLTTFILCKWTDTYLLYNLIL